jgi:hypothetical protein
MPIFFRGDGPGTYWAVNDAQSNGFTARSPHIGHSPDRMMHHIERTPIGATTAILSPYISLTASRDVARVYALFGTRGIATSLNPGFIYEVEIERDSTDPKSTQLYDPVKEIAGSLPAPPAAMPYQHRHYPGILLGVVAPRLLASFMRAGLIGPPGAGMPLWSNVTMQLRCLVHALRDAELLALDFIPKACVLARHSVY